MKRKKEVTLLQRLMCVFMSFVLVFETSFPGSFAYAAEAQDEASEATLVVQGDDAPDEAVVAQQEEAPAPAPAPEPEPEPAPVAEPAPAAADSQADQQDEAVPSDETAGTVADGAQDEAQPATDEATVDQANPEVEVEPETESDAESFPAVTLTGKAGGVNVTVVAPEGALPEGATLHVVDARSQVSAEQMAEVTGAEVNSFRAVDITFRDKDGNEITPRVDVKVTLKSAIVAESVANNGEDPAVVHIDDAGNATLVEQQNAGTATNEVAFQSSDFSIYVIVDGEEGQVEFHRTYHFLNELNTDGSSAGAYEFYNAAGELVDNQIMKNGDVLEDVGTPHIVGRTFLGWRIVTDNGDGTYTYTDETVNFGEALSLDLTADEDVYVAPYYEAVYYVTFHEHVEDHPEDVIQTKKVVYTSGSNANRVLISDVIAPQPTAELIFVGWTLDGTDHDIYGSNGQIQETYI